MKKAPLLLIAAFMGVALTGAGSASASTSKSSFQWFTGTEGVVEGPDEAMASNGDVVIIEGSGALNVSSKSASGEGTFVHMSGGEVAGRGTWRATRLLSFQFYGCGVAGEVARLQEQGSNVVFVGDGALGRPFTDSPPPEGYGHRRGR